MGRAAADNRSRPNRIATLNAAMPRAGSSIGKHCSSSSCSLAMGNAFLLDGHTARFLSRERKWGVWSCGAHAAYLSARRAENPSSIFLTKNPQHGMLCAIKAARKKPFLFTRSREGTAGASPCGTEKAALLSRAAEMPRRSLRYKGTKCPASSGEFRWNHGQ